MSPAAVLMGELAARGIELQAEGGKLRFRPRAAMTPDLAERVKRHKPELLAMLTGDSCSLQQLPQPDCGQGGTHADKEWRRFIAECRPWPDGRGWYDRAEMRKYERLTAPNAPPRLQNGPLANAGRAGGVSGGDEATEPEETAVERAARYREAWKTEGYPPGVRPA
ncbi:MAG TPA: hypothetical protein PLM77_11130 [Phycisphaerae bacterium]|nr:hypothetical protein [Phycisphaerae bacterium]HQE43740.1 hypothetical protein [Phycisphaerae bacterium]